MLLRKDTLGCVVGWYLFAVFTCCNDSSLKTLNCHITAKSEHSRRFLFDKFISSAQWLFSASSIAHHIIYLCLSSEIYSTHSQIGVEGKSHFSENHEHLSIRWWWCPKPEEKQQHNAQPLCKSSFWYHKYDKPNSSRAKAKWTFKKVKLSLYLTFTEICMPNWNCFLALHKTI